MLTGRTSKFVAIGVAVLAFGLTQAMASPHLILHWDRNSGTSRAVVRNSSDDVLAEFPWDGALPRRYAADHEQSEVPTFLLATLRDQLELSSQPGAEDALGFIRDLMGAYADTPVEALPPTLGSWISYSSVNVEEWCGTVVNAGAECTQQGDPSLKTAFCTGFACKRTTLEPKE